MIPAETDVIVAEWPTAAVQTITGPAYAGRIALHQPERGDRFLCVHGIHSPERVCIPAGQVHHIHLCEGPAPLSALIHPKPEPAPGDAPASNGKAPKGS